MVVLSLKKSYTLRVRRDTVSTPTQSANELAENFELLDDWEERYAYIIDLGKKLAPFPEEAKIDDNRIWGCQSRVWLIARCSDGDSNGGHPGGVLEFKADSDAFIVKGLLSLLTKIYNNQDPRAILSFRIEELFERIGLVKHLSPTRSNGLHEVVKRIRAIAAEHDAAH